MTQGTDRHGNPFTDGWIPGNPGLRGNTRTPDEAVAPLDYNHLDALPHRVRVARGLTGPEPDPGYDPGHDDVTDGDQAWP